MTSCIVTRAIEKFGVINPILHKYPEVKEVKVLGDKEIYGLFV
jgi:hypothetical protein